MNGTQWLFAIAIICFALILMVGLVCNSYDKRTVAMNDAVRMDTSNIRQLREE